MPGSAKDRLLSWIDATLAALGHRFVTSWSKVERSYRRPFSAFAFMLKFAFYPCLAVGAIGWLGWDWMNARSLNEAENAIFDSVVRWRPFEPKVSGNVVVVEIDECSIEFFRSRGDGGWPWSRTRHADLLDELDRAHVRAVGFDVLFIDRSQVDPDGDGVLEAMAKGGAGRFVFESSRLHSDYDNGSSLRASAAPGAFALKSGGRDDPTVALLLPYGEAMARYSGVANVTRNEDGVLRDVPLYETAGDWGLPSLPLRLAMAVDAESPQHIQTTVRPNWRQETRLPRISAADLLSNGKPVCRAAAAPMPELKDRIVLVGFTASGLNDAKPTPVDPVMPGVEVMAEATEALIANSGIRTPPTGLKYLLAVLFVLMTTFAFYRGEPGPDIDSAFVAANLILLCASFVGLTFFSFFFDVFASVGFVSLVFGFCRLYAGIQRGRAVGNGDYLPEYDPEHDRWLVVARLRFVPDPQQDRAALARRRREYQRRLRRFLYAGSDAVMLEGVVERKSWLHEALSDLMVLIWHGDSESAARDAAMHDLARLERQLAEQDLRLSDDGSVRVALACVEVDEFIEVSDRRGRWRLYDLVGEVLAASNERPLARYAEIANPERVPSGES